MTMHILDNYIITHPNLRVLFQILLVKAPATGLFQRSYSQLEKLCYKDCHWLKTEDTESLYIPSPFKEPLKMNFEGACSFLERK